MYQFTTTTLINSMSAPAFKGVSGQAHKVRFYVDTKDATNPVLRIARQGDYAADSVVSIYKRPFSDPQYFSATFDLSTIVNKYDDPNTTVTETEGVGRIALYIRLSGSQNSYYANDMVYKGKPFYIEFPIKQGDTVAILAKRIVAIAKKYQNMVYENPLIDIEATGDGKVKITGTDEYQLLTKATLEWFNPSSKSYDCCANFGAFQDEAEGVVVTQGKQGFGTFRQITKDLRLPTAANTRWSRIAQDETPIVGGKYNEYIITMCKNRGIMGGDVVGQEVKSRTTHVFFVLDGEPTTKFDEAIKKLIAANTKIVAELVNKDTDDVALNKDEVAASVGDTAAIKTQQDKAHGTKTSNDKITAE